MDTPARPLPGTLHQHWKGGLYRVEAVATQEADGAPTVVYRPLADPTGRCWTRPLSSFVEPVTGLDGETRARFEALPLPDDRALQSACAAAGVPADVVAATVSRYREPQRHYHAAWHVFDVFARAAEQGLALSRAQVLALLFHDAVYVAGAPAGQNEALSALLLRQAAHGRDALPAADVADACTMILDTAGHVPSSPASHAVLALDLATLGDAPLRFDAWTELVWLEYRHLFEGEADPKRAFLQRRVRVLRGLLEATGGLEALPGWRARFEGNVERVAGRG